MNVSNLEKLRDYLLGEIKSDFDMDQYDGLRTDGLGWDDCGTIGCAVGHGPYAGIVKEVGETWVEYSERVFDLPAYGATWVWCFGALWHMYDNTARGAGLRIDYMLKYGVPGGYICPHGRWIKVYNGHDD